jgi:hypothetical protein
MLRAAVGSLCGLLLCVSGLSAFEAQGVLKKVDAENRVVVVTANGQDHTVKVATDAKVVGTDGKELGDGLKAKEVQEGAAVTVTVERDGDRPVIKAIRLGKRADAGPPPDSGKPSVGLKPLTEMTAADRYKGEDGGLYGGGKNEPPEALQAAARAETARIEPLDADGKPSGDGKIVLVSISMSNATMEFSTFKRLADADPRKSALLTVVDCAQGGQAMAQWADPNARAWEVAEKRLADAGVTPKQVQVAWVKLANAGPRGDLAEHGKKLEKDTVAVLQHARVRFPDLRVAYLSSRIYGGYANTPLNPEPYAYEGAFVVRRLIQDQLKGDAALNADAGRGAVKAPLLLWGPYLWADGTTPRKGDGLVWERRDLGGDGTHPSDSGRKKVAELLLRFFATDANARTWFVKSGGGDGK